MPSAILVLRKEHDAILKMLSAMEEAARRIESGKPVAPETLESLLEFFRLFADRCHHGKEEDLLFPLLESRGLPRIPARID
jgi:hemerythrin-like domain-containing protein